MQRLTAIKLLAWSMAAFSFGVHSAISFGARTQIWPFMFVTNAGISHGAGYSDRVKYDVAIGNLDQYQKLGATWNIVDVWQDLDGPDTFARLTRVIDEHERRGISVSLRLLEKPELYDSLRNGDAEAAKTLSDYSAWVKSVAEKFGGRIRYYMISNEVDHDIGFNRVMYKKSRPIGFDEYVQVIKAGYRTIKSVDETLKVADHGVSSYSLCLAVISDMAMSGRINDALRFWRAMEYGSSKEGERSSVQLFKMLGRDNSRHRIEMARRTVAELASYSDVFQLHHYFGASVVPALLKWVREQMAEHGVVRPVVAAEVGYKTPMRDGKSWDGRPMNVADMEAYSEKDHGNAVAKTIASLAGLGVEDILYWQIRFHNSRSPTASLYPATESKLDFREVYPASVYKYVVHELSGAESVSSVVQDADFIEYRFGRDDELSVVWTEGESVQLPSNIRQYVLSATDATGTNVDMASNGWRLGTSPLFINWRTDSGGNR